MTGIILAGGKSSRMGQDKGLLPYKGMPLILYVINAISPVVNDVLIVTSNKDYEQFGYPLIADVYSEKGPLAGIYSGLRSSESELNLVLGCDMPNVTTELLRYLVSQVKDEAVLLPSFKGKTEQLAGFYSKKCLPIFKQEIEKDNLKIRDAIALVSHRFVEIDEQLAFYKPELFNNLNSPEDLKSILDD